MDQEVSGSNRPKALTPLEEGIELARTGQRSEARAILRGVIRTEPTSEDAWLWLAWVAESSEESLRYLREAQAFLPESTRISEALDWAQQKQSGETVANHAAAAAPRASSRERVRRATQTVDRAAEATQQNVSRAFEEVQEHVSRWRLPRIELPKLQHAAMPLLSIALVLTLFGLAMLGISNARRGMGVVQALELPTPVVDATATPTTEQRIQPMWGQVEVAWTRQDWDKVVETLGRVREIDPYNDEARKRLGEAHYLRGIRYLENNQLDEAQLEMDTAIRLDATSEHLQKARRELGMYRDGLASYYAQDWEQAVERLNRVYKLNTTFRDTQSMLGEALYHWGNMLRDQERWQEALEAYDRSLELRPDLQDAAVQRQVVSDVLTPPKRIEVKIGEKIVTLYEDHQPIHVFRICTGRPSAPTVAGRYQVLDKLPSAYASKWDLDMPWWLGIYWAGGSENGFHALPILSNGSTLWSGSLGTGCSFGCIVLDTQDAITLYNWAEVGDVVIVDP